MWRLAAHILRGTKVHSVLQGRRVLAAATLLPCHRRGTARGAHTSDMSTAIQKVEAPDAEHLVHVHWEDGSESRYPCVWLRDNCQCPDCFLRSAKARRLPFEELDVDIVAKAVTLTDRKKISITWPDEHTSEYEAEWLKKRCFSEAARAEMREDLFLPANAACGHVGQRRGSSSTERPRGPSSGVQEGRRRGTGSSAPGALGFSTFCPAHAEPGSSGDWHWSLGGVLSPRRYTEMQDFTARVSAQDKRRRLLLREEKGRRVCSLVMRLEAPRCLQGLCPFVLSSQLQGAATEL